MDRREDLVNAIALNSSMFNLARLLGPAFGGLLIARVGAGYCYLIDAVSYLAVILSLVRIVPRVSVLAAQRAQEAAARAGHVLEEFLGGLRYVRAFPPIGNTLLLIAAAAFTGFAAPVLLPAMAKDVFGGDARTLGWLMSALGIGAVGSAVYLSTRTTVRGLGRVIALGGMAMGLGLVGCGFCRSLLPALGCLVVSGAGGVLLSSSGNTVIQSLVDDEKRGRVMSLFAMAYMGMSPLGNLAIGALADWRLGVRGTLCLAGAGCALAAVAYFVRLPQLRALAGPVLDRMENAG